MALLIYKYAIKIDFATTSNKEKTLRKPLQKCLENFKFFEHKKKCFTQYMIERKQKSLSWMCEQDKFCFEAYEK